ncbi:hypothetical protein BKP37_14150 [Anaerobacillus alkalilacustris]|uniref:Class II aldolase/adducin N-terminal domain-containing protein n=1 Tax=Anaerobacillus alkalilacustris TaxID=393763 RepID=A0A1S2LJT1_9BACI|nr:class II aldolase/adducin family protein [Anaerobacillus alkalilacustris]OIJ12564.1 hypothetical protein BKP37_14150 [Anaerobacillus alkalilacustris]
MKTVEIGFGGRDLEVIWINGLDNTKSGKEKFSELDLSEIEKLLERDEMSDDELELHLSKSRIDFWHPQVSIETLLHGFLPVKHIDHTFPDMINCLWDSEKGLELAKQIYRKRFIWVPHEDSIFGLAKSVVKSVESNPKVDVIIMENKGILTWGKTSKKCYDKNDFSYYSS